MGRVVKRKSGRCQFPPRSHSYICGEAQQRSVQGRFWGLYSLHFQCLLPSGLAEKISDQGRQEDSSYIFRKVCHPKQGYKLRKHRLTYSKALEPTRGQLAAIGLKSKEYCLHSMRSGGASLAAALGLSDRLIMLHGGRKSDSSKNHYISESKSSLLSVSKALGWGATHHYIQGLLTSAQRSAEVRALQRALSFYISIHFSGYVFLQFVVYASLS